MYSMQTLTRDRARRKIANYELHELIDWGGMASIYRGVQLSLDRPIALKILHQHLTRNEAFIARFEKEAKQAALLAHSNIVAIIDYGHEGDDYFIAMEYIEGMNLKEIMGKLRRLPLEVALLIAREVASGLKYAHNSGIAHRDIKPANIMLSSDGRVVITDFGIARNNLDVSSTATGLAVGSPAYMSPEQAAARPTDHRTDIFSLGIVLYEVITGDKPFEGETYQEVTKNVISGPVIPASKLRVDVTESIEGIINRALEKDIERRYQAADEMISDLERELACFVIPSEPNLISEFLRDPIQTTMKLRQGKIDKHIESALYLVNIGHGRLTDARKEFENVLRFDKNNKLAKQYLEKLQQSSDNPHMTLPPRKVGFPSWTGLVVIIAGLLLLSLVVFLKVDRGEKSGAGAPTSVRSSGAEQSKATGRFDPAAKENVKSESNGETSHSAGLSNQNLAEFGWLQVKSEPVGTFSVDATVYGRTNGRAVKMAPGKHTITIKADGYQTARRRIITEKGETEEVSVQLRRNR